MKTSIRLWILTALMAAFALVSTGVAAADPVTVIGTLSQITLAPDGKSAEIVLKDEKTGKDVMLQIADDETLDKLKDKRVTEGDEVRVRYEPAGGKNLSKSFRKVAGC